jgi:hypothetical protein
LNGVKRRGNAFDVLGLRDRIGNCKDKDCIRPIELDKGTVNYPKAKEYQKMKVAEMILFDEEENSPSSALETSQEEDEDKSGGEQAEEEESEHEISAAEYFD